MGSRNFQRLLVFVFSSFVFVPIASHAQDIALLTSVKGKVSVRNPSGQIHSAAIKHKLSIGDEVETSAHAFAIILYYTGKEIYLPAGKKHIVARDGNGSSFLRRLGEVFSNLLWSPKPTKTVLGASRGWKDAGRRVVVGISPSFTMLPARSVRFEWTDNQQKPGRKYETTIRDRSGIVRTTMTVLDTNLTLIKSESLGPLNDTLRWQVTELNSGFQSEEVTFFFLPDAGREGLTRELRQVREMCAKDSTEFRRLLYESILYADLNLLIEAEASLAKLVKLRPDFVVGHEMLADVYARVGKLDEALAEQVRIRSLLED